MANVNNILYLFDDLVQQKYPGSGRTKPSAKDHEIADQLFLIFDQLFNANGLEFDNIKTLDSNVYDDDEEYQEENHDDTSHNIDGVRYSYNTMCTIVEYSKTHTFTSLRSRYKRIKSKQHLHRIKQYVKEQGTKFDKFQRIDEFVYTEFMRARKAYLPIHDSDVRRLAIKKAREINLNDFVASHHWLINFKSRHHISSRKITKLVTKHHVEDRNEILKSGEDFVKKVKDKVPKYAEDHILNTDQSSFK